MFVQAERIHEGDRLNLPDGKAQAVIERGLRNIEGGQMVVFKMEDGHERAYAVDALVDVAEVSSS